MDPEIGCLIDMTITCFFVPYRLASAKLSVSFSEIEDVDSVLELEARKREGGGGGGEREREYKIDANMILKQPHEIEISIGFIGRLVRSRLSPCTQTRSLSRAGQKSNGIHCVTRHLPQIKLIANKTLALKSHREARLDSSGIPARTSCY